MSQCSFVLWMASTTLSPALQSIVANFCAPRRPIVTIRAFGSGTKIRTIVVEPEQRLFTLYFRNYWEFVYLAQDGTVLPALTLLRHHPIVWVMQKEWRWPTTLAVIPSITPFEWKTRSSYIINSENYGIRFCQSSNSAVQWFWRSNAREIGSYRLFPDKYIHLLGWTGFLTLPSRHFTPFDVLDALTKAIAEAPARTAPFGFTFYFTTVDRVATDPVKTGSPGWFGLILLTQQQNQWENGVYNIQNGVWHRQMIPTNQPLHLVVKSTKMHYAQMGLYCYVEFAQPHV